MGNNITPEEITTVISILKATIPLGVNIYNGIKALFSIKYGTMTIDDIEAKWQADLDEATKNANS